MRVRQPLYGLNGAWHCTLVLLFSRPHGPQSVLIGALLGWLVGRDIQRVFIGTYVR